MLYSGAAGGAVTWPENMKYGAQSTGPECTFTTTWLFTPLHPPPCLLLIITDLNPRTSSHPIHKRARPVYKSAKDYCVLSLHWETTKRLKVYWTVSRYKQIDHSYGQWPSAQCLMTQTSRNLSTFNFASLMPFFRLITPFLYFYRWFLRQNDVYMQKVPWFIKLKFSAELCRGPGPAGCRTATRRQGHTHTPATTITGDYVAK